MVEKEAPGAVREKHVQVLEVVEEHRPECWHLLGQRAELGGQIPIYFVGEENHHQKECHGVFWVQSGRCVGYLRRVLKYQMDYHH